MKRIGKKIDGVNYSKRPGSYVIVTRKNDKKIAIVLGDDSTYFFLGGGIENDESELEALKREVLEESGYSMKNINFFDKVSAWTDGVARGPLDITATFYIAEFDKKVTEPIEKDHHILWVNPDDYKDKLFHEYQRYILEEYINKKIGR